MAERSATLTAGGVLVMASGLLHLPFFLIAGTGAFAAALAWIGVVWLVLGFGIWRLRWRLLAWLGFLAMLFGGVAAYAGTGYAVGNAVWLFAAIAAVDLLAAFLLFLTLWQPRAAIA